MLNMYLAVTKEDVWRVYNTYIKDKGCVTVSVLSKDRKTVPPNRITIRSTAAITRRPIMDIKDCVPKRKR